MTDKTDSKERDLQRIAECAARLVEHADFQLGGVLSADSKARDIPSRACSQVKARHLAALRDALAGRASLAASSGSEPVAWRVRRHDAPNYWIIFLHRPVDALADPEREVQPLYTHPSPPEGMVGGWTKASQQLPPCRDDQLYLGVNTAGFAGVFNAVVDIAGDVHCMYETPEETIDVMRSLDIWKPFTPPTTSAGSGKGE